MIKRASLYLKPKIKDESLDTEAKEVPSSPPKRDSFSPSVRSRKKSQEELKSQEENSKITESSQGETSSDTDDDEDEKDDQIPQLNQALHSLSRIQSLPSSGPRLDRAASIFAKHRTSTFDPSTLKRLKSVRIETLKPDDQIEVFY